tara:strand:+ start:6830 stop:7135 length:306 start_codon:yes stop_codon:yes gene_type:complete
MTQTIKITASEIKVGMKIQIGGLFQYEGNPAYENKANDFSVETANIRKKSPVYTVTSITEPIATDRYRTQHKTVTRKEMHITFAEVEGVCDISSKNKVVLV